MPGEKEQIIWRDGRLLTSGPARSNDRLYHGMRLWRPEKSKVAALFHLGYTPKIINSRVLYLGAAAGTTVSYIADYAEIVYAVEFARNPMLSLLKLCHERNNIIPLYGDARYPERYIYLVEEVDLMIQDISQRDQVDILVRNMGILKSGGRLILFLKMLCMGIEKSQDEIINDTIINLSRSGVSDIQLMDMERYHKGHVAFTGTILNKIEYSPKQIRTAVTRSRASYD